MEHAASEIVQFLYHHLVDTGPGDPACALVRCFKTHRFGQLPSSLVQPARAALVDKQPRPDLPCLTLLATAGQLPAWNDRRQTTGHAAIPLESVEIVQRAPMIASLIHQMGLEIEAALYPNPQLLLDSDQHAFNVFHVEHAPGDPSIPAQGFVSQFNIQSVLGFGGLLPSGDLFAVILFSKVPIRRETAALFRTIALAVKLALLPHTRGPYFEPEEGEDPSLQIDPSRLAFKDDQIRSEVATLHLLLTTLEDAAIQQTMRLQDAYDELKLQGELVQTSEERLRLAQQAARIASWDWNLLTDAVIWNEGTARTFGRPPSEMASMQQILSYVHEDDLAQVRADLAPAIAGRGEYRSNFRVLWPDGSIRWIQAFGEAVFTGNKTIPGSPDCTPVRIVGVNLDVSERRLAEEALIRNEKLAAVGRLASSIAHEINNPLESVTNLLYLAKKSSDLGEAHDYLNTADIELRRVSAIANQTLRFNRQSTKPIRISCHELIGSTFALYQGRLNNSSITVERRKRANRPALCFDGEIRQVIGNLVVNAIDAMPSGGRLLVRSREGYDWRTQRPGLVITIADTGTGLSKQVRERIFEAFYTTKGIGGTGLGLWISREILDRHHGKLWVRSTQRPGRSGSVFAIFLPFEGPTPTHQEADIS
jgi:PAS domain S-box-containing protein